MWRANAGIIGQREGFRCWVRPREIGGTFGKAIHGMAGAVDRSLDREQLAIRRGDERAAEVSG